jgi:hypothetical protein
LAPHDQPRSPRLGLDAVAMIDDMSETPAAAVAHPEALVRWREVAGEPDPAAVAWAERVLGVTGQDQQTA